MEGGPIAPEPITDSELKAEIARLNKLVSALIFKICGTKIKDACCVRF
jgi:hypothetical protein